MSANTVNKVIMNMPINSLVSDVTSQNMTVFHACYYYT